MTVFIPPCTNSLCEDKLKALGESLISEDFKIEENIYAGSKTKHFKDSARACSLTILHKCPDIWKFIRIGNLDKFLTEENDLNAKMLCVQFAGLSYDELTKDERSRQRFDNFFEDLNMQDISTESKLQNCVNYIKSLVQKLTDTTVQKPKPKSLLRRCVSRGFDYARLRASTNMDSKERQFLRKLHNLRKKDVKRSSNEHGSFDMYPSEHAAIKVLAKVMDGDQIGTNQLNINTLKTFEELKGHINEVLNTSTTALSSFQFLLHTALPQLYTDDLLHGLVTMATCDDSHLQNNAMSCAELLVLKGKLHAPDTDLQMLIFKGKDDEDMACLGISGVLFKAKT
ncbi:hypothetical protein Btru_009763 [Bulinus truncatus]|nr:hypothetical protein Btru_009763 [Bulinus truncatus]